MHSVRENPKNYTHLYMQAVENMNLVQRVTAVKPTVSNQVPKTFQQKRLAKQRLTKLAQQAVHAENSGLLTDLTSSTPTKFQDRLVEKGSKVCHLNKEQRLKK